MRVGDSLSDLTEPPRFDGDLFDHLCSDTQLEALQKLAKLIAVD